MTAISSSKTTMKFIAPLALCLNGAAASLSEIAMKSNTPRRVEDESLNSNDKIDYLSYQKYNCDGMFLDWTGQSAFTTSLSETVVEYHYDAYIEADSDKTIALASIQNRLLRYVGPELLGDCERRLSEGLAIQEITTAPGDQPASSAPCAVETEFQSIECIAVNGGMTVYYFPSGDRASDEARINSQVKAAVKRGMDTNVAVTDTTKAVYYIGDRDNPSVTKSSFMLSNEAAPSFWDKGGAKLAVGLCAAAFAALFLLLCYRMGKCRSNKKEDDFPDVINDIEAAQEITTQKSTKSFKTKSTKKSTRSKNSRKDEEVVEDDSAFQKFGMTCCWD